MLLFSYQFSVMVDRSVDEYKKKLTNEYSIVVVSNRVLTFKEVKKSLPSLLALNHIDKSRYIKKLSNENISKEDLTYLKDSLPEFYSIKLDSLPTPKELQLIKSKLLSINGVTNVEVYKKSFKKLYRFLLLAKGASLVFTIFIFLTSTLLIIKQIEIWTYEHQNRMYIMGLFGAPYWLKSASLYKLVIIDSFIATILTSIVFLYLPYIADFSKVYSDIGINLINFSFFKDTFMLLFLSITLSILAVTITIFRQSGR